MAASSSWLADPAALMAVAASAAALYGLVSLIRFVKADSTLSMLRKPLPPADGFQDKVVWIVGASQGIGEVIARYFHSRGAKVILSARNRQGLERVALECGGKGKASVLPLDIKASSGDMKAAAAEAYNCFGGARVDVLVQVVGASQRAMAEETLPEIDEEMFALNTLGPIRLTKAVLPRMLEARSGHVAVVSSMAGILASPGQATYAATKHALQGFFKSLAVEICDRGVGVSLICPGPVMADPSKSPRRVFGALGMVDGADGGSSSTRVTSERVAELLGAAVYHNCPEVVVARHPVLLLSYVFRLLPALGWYVLRKVGPKRARAVKEGRSGYEVSSVMNDDKNKSE